MQKGGDMEFVIEMILHAIMYLIKLILLGG